MMPACEIEIDDFMLKTGKTNLNRKKFTPFLIQINLFTEMNKKDPAETGRNGKIVQIQNWEKMIP